MRIMDLAQIFLNAGINATSYFNGTNVGIGTTAPGAKLDVIDDSSSASIRTRHPNLSQGISIDYNTIAANGSTANQNIFLNPKGTSGVGIGAGLGTATSNTLGVYGNMTVGGDASYYGVVAPTNGMLIEGNVGIGSTAPLYKLDVNGNVGIGSTVYFASNVGIGTTNPAGILHLVKDGAAYLYFGDNTTSSRGWIGMSNSLTNGLQVGAFTAEPMSFWTNSARRMTIDSSGNVGIGTAAPGTKLDVKASAQNDRGDQKIFICLHGTRSCDAFYSLEFRTCNSG